MTYRRTFKRLLDLVVSAAGLVVLSPVLAGVAILVALRLGRPVLFWQERFGLGERPFRMVKFRTMTDAHDPAGHPLPDAERLTPFGWFLRSTSLDELPELWNVLRGEMSLVGPRPLLARDLGTLKPGQERRHEVRPGITGWAQINGRNAISWEEKFALDVWYVDHHSFGLDARILGRTLRKVVVRDGISADGEAAEPGWVGASPPPSRMPGSVSGLMGPRSGEANDRAAAVGGPARRR